MTEYWANGQSALYHADAREIPLPSGSVHCIVTSPPYWGLRDYSLEDAGIGLEATFGEHVENILAVFRELRRVLRDDGIAWLNYGDAYSGSWGNYGARQGEQREQSQERFTRPAYEDPEHGWTGRPPTSTMQLPSKNLIGMPWRLAFALQDDGWYLRSAPAWVKPNPMPESVRDRPTSAYEMVFMLTKSPRYFYDIDAVRLPVNQDSVARYGRQSSYGLPESDDKPYAMKNGPRGRREDAHTETKYDTETSTAGRLALLRQKSREEGGEYAQPSGANLRNVWEIPTQPRPDAHFATFPDALPRRCILLSTSAHGVCETCGAQWERQVDVQGRRGHDWRRDAERTKLQSGNSEAANSPEITRTTTGWSPSCSCDAGVEPAVVLDPFVGSGTTAAVAQSLGRRGLGLDLNPEYLDLAVRRLSAVPLSLF